MRAIVRTKYGPPDVLQLKEVEKPVPKDKEVLIKVHATSVNASDWELLRGKPLFTRAYGLRKPKMEILGTDIAGRVETVGKSVTQFQPGDEVFGDIFESWGGFAEYVCAPANNLMLKPDSMTFEQASAVPQAACIALQGLRDKGQIQAGQKVLINGAGGGAGSFAVQMAKAFGAEVTGVDNTEKLDMMRSIGADQIIDYTQEDFTKKGQRYDLILDLAAHHSILGYRRALSPKGRYFMALKKNKDMASIIELIEAGKVVPVIDRSYPLGEVAEALQYLGEGHARGKLVITVDHGNKT
jgi:NADPH:quinone reductase-like Zn-dependent oxidoreductase